MTRLDPGILVAAAALELSHEPLPDDQVVAGAPTTGVAVLLETDELEIGVWEMTPGTATDVEVDEVFIVLSGDATVTGVAAEPLDLGPGSVVRLSAGMATEWVVRATLRKVYVVGSALEG